MSEMPTQLPSELQFSSLIELRKHVLAWISRDVGLSNFLIPDVLAPDWTAEQRQTWATAVLDKFLHVHAKTGKIAREHIVSCETAGGLRRSCLKLRQRKASIRDVVKTSVALENLWNAASTGLDDSKWARCSMLFDTALISLRLLYLVMYLKAEDSGANTDVDTRKVLFNKLVASFFSDKAPSDEELDKHSTNFKRLLQVWREELQEYSKGESFESLLLKLESTQTPDLTAVSIERFLSEVDVDSSWILDMKKLDTEVAEGVYIRKQTPKKRGRPPPKHPGPRSSPRRSARGKPPSPINMDGDISSDSSDSDSDFDSLSYVQNNPGDVTDDIPERKTRAKRSTKPPHMPRGMSRGRPRGRRRNVAATSLRRTHQSSSTANRGSQSYSRTAVPTTNVTSSGVAASAERRGRAMETIDVDREEPNVGVNTENVLASRGLNKNVQRFTTYLTGEDGFVPRESSGLRPSKTNGHPYREPDYEEVESSTIRGLKADKPVQGLPALPQGQKVVRVPLNVPNGQTGESAAMTHAGPGEGVPPSPTRSRLNPFFRTTNEPVPTSANHVDRMSLSPTPISSNAANSFSIVGRPTAQRSESPASRMQRLGAVLGAVATTASQQYAETESPQAEDSK